MRDTIPYHTIPYHTIPYQESQQQQEHTRSLVLATYVETRSSIDMAGSANKMRKAILVLFIWAVAMLFFMAALHPNGN
jgi:hypothetical protein